MPKEEKKRAVPGANAAAGGARKFG